MARWCIVCKPSSETSLGGKHCRGCSCSLSWELPGVRFGPGAQLLGVIWRKAHRAKPWVSTGSFPGEEAPSRDLAQVSRLCGKEKVSFWEEMPHFSLLLGHTLPQHKPCMSIQEEFPKFIIYP